MRKLLLLSVLFLAAAGPAWSATATLPPGAVLVDNVRSFDVDARAAALEASIAVGGDAAALTALTALTDPVLREATAARLLDRLQQRGAMPSDALLGTLAGWPVLVYRRHEETTADWFVPVFDLPGKVQSLRLLQAREHEVTALLTAMAGKRGDDAARVLAQASPQAAALAIDAASAATLDTLRARSKATGATLPSPAVAALARRMADAETFLHALDTAAPLDVLPLFSSTLPALSQADADAVLRDALARPAYASAAAFALVQRDADAPLLRSLLAAPDTGPSVAAALARAPHGLARIDSLLADTQADAGTLTHLALALRLRGDADAGHRLETLRDDPRLPASVRAELQR